jgi:hypothetical protein
VNIGNLPPEIESFVNRFKSLGYSTRTQLIADAVKCLKQQKSRLERETQREKWLQEYSETSPENTWSELDGEDFK